MTTLIDIGTLIVSTPGTCGGRPRIAGHRITVELIAIEHKAGLSAAEIVTERPQLTLAQVHAALAFYYANQAEIDASIAAEELELERWEAEYRAGKL
ncbi:MAG: DUF433 domain-containing protein [Phormidium sp.]